MSRPRIKCIRCGKEFKVDFTDCVALCKKCRMKGTMVRYKRRWSKII
ncbi:MAG: hypothetical protein ACFE9T_00720 [Promethearchaeota archaeon]